MKRFYNESVVTPKWLFLNMCKRQTKHILDCLSSLEGCVDDVEEAKEFIRQLLEIDKDVFDNSEYEEMLKDQMTVLADSLKTLKKVVSDIKVVKASVEVLRDDSLKNG